MKQRRRAAISAAAQSRSRINEIDDPVRARDFRPL
jgi:hypothetical protein